MTGDTTIQVIIFIIGVLVFTVSMAGGILVAKEWKRRDDQALVPAPIRIRTER